MTSTLALLYLQYLALVFGASCGFLQAVFAMRGIEGMRFFHNPALSYLFSAIVFIASFAWFYAGGNRNQLPVVEGVQQSVLFVLGALAAVLFTALVSSLVNRRMPAVAGSGPDAGPGLGSLRRMTYLQYVRSRRNMPEKADRR